MIILGWILAVSVLLGSPFMVYIVLPIFDWAYDKKRERFGGSIWRNKLNAEIDRLERELGMSDKAIKPDLVKSVACATTHTIYDGEGKAIRTIYTTPQSTEPHYVYH